MSATFFTLQPNDQFYHLCFPLQQMAPAKQAKVIKEFQKQSAQLDMTVIFPVSLFLFLIEYNIVSMGGRENELNYYTNDQIKSFVLMDMSEMQEKRY